MEKLKIDELINKSLDDIDALIEDLKNNSEVEVVSKGMNLPPEEVSEDTPEDTPEEETPEEGGEPMGDVEEGGEEGMGEEEEEEDEDDMDDVDKSLESTLKGNDNVRKALEVSEFLDELVKGLSTILTGHKAEIQKSITSSEYSSEIIAKSMQGLFKSQKAVIETITDLSKSNAALLKRLGKLEAQPLVRKSVQTAQALDKSFGTSTTEATGSKLSKSQAVMKLTEAYEKGNSDLRNDILALEGTGDFGVLTDNAKHLLGL